MMKGNCGECERRWVCDIDPDKCDEWPDPVPMTNADHIRAMTDEELVEWLADMWDCNYCSEHERLGDNPLLSAEQCDQKCEQHCLDWLQQPVKEGADHEI